MTLKEIKKYYNVRSMDGYYDLSSLEVGNSRMVHKYICSIYRHNGSSFYVKGNKPTYKVEELLTQINSYLDNLEYDSEYYCPSYRKGTAQDWFLHDKLNEYGFKKGGWGEPSGYSLKRDSIYSFRVTDFTIDYTVYAETEVPKVIIYIHTGKWSFAKVECTFDLKDIHEKLDSLLKPLLLTEGIQNITLSEKMEMSDIDVVMLKLKGMELSTSKVDLKNKLLELAESL